MSHIQSPYKPQYSEEEINELLSWFDKHQFEGSIDLGKGEKVLDLKKAIGGLTHIARNYNQNPNFSGEIHTLFHLRDELIRQGRAEQ
jgi:hypothetical protein